MENRDPVKRNRASVALGRMGAPGGAVLIQGMRNPSKAVRLDSLQSVTRDQLLGQRGESLALLRQLLADPDPDIRRAAAARIPWYGEVSPADLRTLQQMAKEDEAPEVRSAAADALYAIDQNVKSGGKSTRGVGRAEIPKKK